MSDLMRPEDEGDMAHVPGWLIFCDWMNTRDPLLRAIVQVLDEQGVARYNLAKEDLVIGTGELE